MSSTGRGAWLSFWIARAEFERLSRDARLAVSQHAFPRTRRTKVGLAKLADDALAKAIEELCE